MDNAALKQTFARRYRIIGILLVLSPAGAIAASFVLGQFDQKKFFIETFGLLVFAAYWAVKSREMAQTEAEIQAAAGRAAQVPGRGVVKKEKAGY